MGRLAIDERAPLGGWDRCGAIRAILSGSLPAPRMAPDFDGTIHEQVDQLADQQWSH